MTSHLDALLAALVIGVAVSSGSFALSKWLLVKSLTGPANALTTIRRWMGVIDVGEAVVYNGSFTSKLLQCHNCLAPYTTLLVAAAVGLLVRAPVESVIIGYTMAVGGVIFLFDYLDIDYE